jgi:hypothetical protein
MVGNMVGVGGPTIRSGCLPISDPVFGTDPDWNGALEETPGSWTDSCRWLSHLGVCAPYATRLKRRYEANQVWLNTTFISQGSQSWGKLAIETWRVKTELIIITILTIQYNTIPHVSVQNTLCKTRCSTVIWRSVLRKKELHSTYKLIY